MSRGAVVFRRALRDQITTIDPVRGRARMNIGQAPGRDMIRMGLADLVEIEGEPRLVLTELGRGVRELIIEVKAAEDAMKAAIGLGMVTAAGRAAPRPISNPPAPPLNASVQSRGPTCGTLNHGSFADFVSRLNEAGLNGWSGNPEHRRNACPAKASSNG